MHTVADICRSQSEQFVALSVEHSLAFVTAPAATTQAYSRHQLGTNIEMLYLLIMSMEIELDAADIPTPAFPSL